jgi:hypothetical protein
MVSLPPLPANYAVALKLIDEAHAHDPNLTDGSNGDKIPYELHYAQKMTRWLAVRAPNASPVLQLACRAQHFRRFVFFFFFFCLLLSFSLSLCLFVSFVPFKHRSGGGSLSPSWKGDRARWGMPH